MSKSKIDIYKIIAIAIFLTLLFFSLKELGILGTLLVIGFLILTITIGVIFDLVIITLIKFIERRFSKKTKK